MENYRVVCVDAKNKPAIVPASSWIENGEVYTVVGVANMANQGMVLGYKLKEKSFPADCPYKYYIASRFRPYTEADAEAERAVEELMLEELIEI